MKTSREFYERVAEQLRTRKGQTRSLEEFLLALRGLLQPHCARDTLSLDELAACLTRAFDAPVPPLDGATSGDGADVVHEASFAAVDRRLRALIVDLREMAEDGTLEDDHRYFGVDAPSGARWYNFDPLTFLECGARGAFGGWEEGDDTGVMYVPGKVAVLGPDGITAVDPRDVPDPVRQMPVVTWEEVAAFLECGQGYE